MVWYGMVWYGMVWLGGAGQFLFYICFYIYVVVSRKDKGMKLESFGCEAIENLVEHTEISRQVRQALLEICAKIEEFEFTSPWKNSIEKILKNGKKLTIGKAGAKYIEDSKGDVLVYRKFYGYGPTLEDGTPTLRFHVDRPSGRTSLLVKPRLDGHFSPVRL